MNEIYHYRFYLLGVLLLINLASFWPGVEMFDSQAQYLQAVSGQYSDHHPPLMAFLWRYLAYIYPGTGLIFSLQLLLIYSAVAVLLATNDYLNLPAKAGMSFCLLLLPIYPQILIYEVVILKDVLFGASLLLAAAGMAYYTIVPKKIPPLIVLALVILLFYGAGLKYQGQYCVVVLAMWLAAIFKPQLRLWRKIVLGVILYLTIFTAISYSNYLLVPMSRRDYAWQYVKLYDLAALSLALEFDLIPAANKTPGYSFTALHTRFMYPAIDSLVFFADPILQVAKTPHASALLKTIWWQNILGHPYLYLQHRAKNMQQIVCARPGYGLEASDVPLTFTPSFVLSGKLSYLVSGIIGICFYVFMSHGTVLLLGCAYLILSLYTWRDSNVAPVLLGLSATALLMVVLLFFMSMAGTPRYTYISVLMIHAAHIFAYICWQKLCARR